MAYKKHRKTYKGKSKLDKAYKSYLSHRKNWEEKGYQLQSKLSKKEFAQYYQQAIEVGEQNIPREFARHERIITGEAARRLRKTAREYDVELTKQEIIGTKTKEEILQLYLDVVEDEWMDDGSQEAREHNRYIREGFEAIYG